MGEIIAGFFAIGIPLAVVILKLVGIIYLFILGWKLFGKLEKWLDKE